MIAATLKRRPRGKRNRAPLLLPIARVALFSADELLKDAHDPARSRYLKQRMQDIGIKVHGPRRALAAALTDRALDGAWAKYGLTRPVDPDSHEVDAQRVYVDWLQGHRPRDLKALRRSLEAAITQWDRRAPTDQDISAAWEDRLLWAGDGRAAEDFFLI